MTCIRIAYEEAVPASAALPPRLILLMAAGAGLSVASLYYNQPMLGLLGADLHAETGMVGLVPTLTQLGYALGILLLSPLGDRLDRRHIILAKAVILALTLLMSSLAPGVGWLLAASLATGVAATMAQDIVPGAAALAPGAQRGKVVGTVMTGLLLGILLSRVVAQYVGLSRSTMEKLRLTGDGPRYAKLGKVCAYSVQDLDSWANARLRTSTSSLVKTS